ncbi:MAG TPA: hypothetical protein VLX92_13935 [Kofleriaceae bacterium]|nr:hypothetical protein [Kofleriaceae bacterium]
MTRALAAIVLAACGTAPPAPPRNRVAAAPASPAATLGVLVVEELGHCATPHDLAISVDGEVVQHVRVECVPPPQPNARVVVVDSSPHVIDGKPLAIAAGRHRLAVRDAETGASDEHTGEFPVHGSLRAPQPDKQPPADVIIIQVEPAQIAIDVAVRANLIIL